MEREYFRFYVQFYEHIKLLNDNDKGNVLMAIVEYCLFEKEPKGLNDLCNYAFMTLKSQLDFDIKQYKNGCKGGAPKGNNNAQKNNPKTTQKQPKNNQNFRVSTTSTTIIYGY